MKRLRPYLEPVVRRRATLRKWRMMACCWGILLVISGLAGLQPAQEILPEHTVELLAFMLVAGTGGILFHNRRRGVVDYQQLAREVEEKHPELHASLLTAIEQEPDPETGKFNFLQERVIEKAVDEFDRTSFANAAPIEQIRGFRNSAICMLILICAALTQIEVVPLVKTGTTSGESSPPLADEKETKIARLDKVDPGDSEIERGDRLPVLAHFSEGVPEKVFAVITPQDGEARRIPMIRTLNDPIFGATLPNVDGPYEYRVEYDGQRSETFSVKVFEYPALVQADATLTYPEYTKLSERVVEDTRRLSVMEGTRLAYKFHLNKPVASARLVAQKDEETVELETHPDKPLATLPPLTMSKTRKWKLELTDDAGRANQVSRRIEIVVYPNKPPKIKIVSPRGDQQVSPIEEVSFEAKMEDDFGLSARGFSYNLNGGELRDLTLGQEETSPLKALASHLLALEDLEMEPGQLVSWFFWAEDVGPDGKSRRSFSDMFFAEVRPFEEIFRQGMPGEGEPSEEQKKLGQKAEELIKLQKQIINATWTLHRKPATLAKDSPVLIDSQYKALQMANELLDLADNEKAKDFVRDASAHMEEAIVHLTPGTTGETIDLMLALAEEQGAYQALLGLLAHEFEVSQSKGKPSQQPQQQSERAQSQLDQLDLRERDDRYETESEAQRLQDPKQREQLQALSRLKELAQRQKDLNEKLKEAENALRAAEDPEEQEEIERQLKRLRDEQRQNLADLDELNQRMEKPENRNDMAEQRKDLEQTRKEMSKASEQLEKGQVSEAIASGTRAEKNLEQMRDELREQTSSQFSEEMREMRRDARELSLRQEEIGRELEKEEKIDKPLSLGEDEKENEIAQQFDQQKDKLENLLKDMKEVVEQSELAEPLLNRKLYDSFRQAHQDQTEKSLEAASTLLREEEDALSNYPLLRSLEQVMTDEPEKRELIDQLRKRDFNKASKALSDRSQRKLDDLKEGVEEAAESVLGNEAEAIKFAERELRQLEQALQNERADAEGEQAGEQPGEQQGKQPGEQANNQPGQQPGEQKGEQPGEQPGQQPGEQPGQQPGEQANNQPGEQQGQQPGEQQGEQPGEQANNQPGEQPGEQAGQQPGEQAGQQSGEQAGQQPGEQKGEQANNQPGEQPGQQPGQQPSEQAGQQPGQQPGEQPGGQPGQQPGQQPGEQQSSNQSPSEQLSFLEKGGAENAGGRNPITGGENRKWTDRLRDVEEAVDLPGVSERVKQIREDLSKMQREFIRHSKEPEWNLVEMQMMKPIHELRRQLAEELAKIKSDKALVPIDRDPVPDAFEELVRRYYLRLGKGE